MAPIRYTSSDSWPKDAELKGELDELATVEPTTSRRLTARNVVLGSLLCLAGLSLLQTSPTVCLVDRPHTVEERAHRILSESPLIDSHVDFALALRFAYGNHIDNKDFTDKFENGTLLGDVDLKRLREGQSAGAFWSIWSPCPKDGMDFGADNYLSSIKFTLEQIDIMDRLQKLYPNDFSRSQGLTSKTAFDAFVEGKLISPYGVEGLHQIGNSASTLRRYYEQGARYATLTHNCHNMYADAAQEEHPLRLATPLWNGVSDHGKNVIHEMNRIGMMVDLSHVSAKTMQDVLIGKEGWSGSRAPILFSHSSAYAICPHPRNVPDDILHLVKKRNSVVQVNVGSSFLACEDVGAEDGIPIPIPGGGNLAKVADHIEYIGELIGYDHVGIGTDFDGILDQPEGFEDVTKYPDLIAELLRRGVSDSDAAKVAGANVLRVWSDAEEVAAQMQAEGAPVLEDELDYDGPYEMVLE